MLRFPMAQSWMLTCGPRKKALLELDAVPAAAAPLPLLLRFPRRGGSPSRSRGPTAVRRRRLARRAAACRRISWLRCSRLWLGCTVAHGAARPQLFDKGG